MTTRQYLNQLNTVNKKLYLNFMRRVEQSDDTCPTLQQINEQVDFRDLLEKQIAEAISSVTPKQIRAIFELRHIQNMRFSRIAREYGTDIKTIKIWYQEALPMVIIPENPIDIRNYEDIFQC